MVNYIKKYIICFCFITDIVASFAVGSPFTFCDNIGLINRIKLKETLGPLEKVCFYYGYIPRKL